MEEILVSLIFASFFILTFNMSNQEGEKKDFRTFLSISQSEVDAALDRFEAELKKAEEQKKEEIDKVEYEKLRSAACNTQ